MWFFGSYFFVFFFLSFFVSLFLSFFLCLFVSFFLSFLSFFSFLRLYTDNIWFQASEKLAFSFFTGVYLIFNSYLNLTSFSLSKYFLYLSSFFKLLLFPFLCVSLFVSYLYFSVSFYLVCLYNFLFFLFRFTSFIYLTSKLFCHLFVLLVKLLILSISFYFFRLPLQYPSLSDSHLEWHLFERITRTGSKNDIFNNRKI